MCREKQALSVNHQILQIRHSQLLTEVRASAMLPTHQSCTCAVIVATPFGGCAIKLSNTVGAKAWQQMGHGGLNQTTPIHDR